MNNQNEYCAVNVVPPEDWMTDGRGPRETKFTFGKRGKVTVTSTRGSIVDYVNNQFCYGEPMQFREPPPPQKGSRK